MTVRKNLSRRKFLRGAGVAAGAIGASTLVPRAALATTTEFDVLRLSGGPLVDPTHSKYGAVSVSTTDGSGPDSTLAFQRAADDIHAKGQGRGVLLINGRFNVKKLQVWAGMTLLGVGAGGAGGGFIQPPGVNGNCVEVGDGGTGYLEEFYAHNFYVNKARPASDTLGSGLVFKDKTGELCSIVDFQSSFFPEAGIRALQGGTTLSVRRVSVMANKQFGVDLQGSGWQTVSVDGVSGDGNKIALIRIKGASGPLTSFALKHLKSESKEPGGVNPYTVVLLESTHGVHVAIENINAQSNQVFYPGSTIDSLVKIIGTEGMVVLRAPFRGVAVRNIINDAWKGRVVGWGTNRYAELGYSSTNATSPAYSHSV